MKKKVLLATAMTLLAGCVATPSDTMLMTCPGQNKKDIRIEYGDGKIDVDYRTTASIKNDQKIVLQLKAEKALAPPDGSGTNYDTLPIRIRGKTSRDAKVIDLVIAASDPKERRTICLENVDQGIYRFFVEVPGVGTIDPIVDVIP